MKYMCYICLCMLVSCRQSLRLEQALQLADDNRAELEKVLVHYRVEQPDRQKLKAAQFLIENMIGKISLDTFSVAANQPYFDALVEYRRQHGYYDRGIYIISDSIRNLLDDNGSTRTPRYVSDLSRLTAAFLVAHIDRSFEVWQKYSWATRLTFDDFCNYVLPYRTTDSYWEETFPYFRKIYDKKLDSLSDLSSVEAGKYIAADIKNGFHDDICFFTEHFPHLQPITFRNIADARVGECIDMNALTVSALRSMGIPATLEMVPFWGNSGGRHYWTRIIGEPVHDLHPNTQMRYTCPDDELISNTFWIKEILKDTANIPPQVNMQTNRTVPKVYRERYAIQSKSLAMQAKEEIPRFFKNLGLEDVTDKYVTCRDVTVSLSFSPTPRRYAYLCCYSSEQTAWTSVSWAEIRRGKVTFRNMGINILYMPAYCLNGNMIPAGEPFILTSSGVCRYLKPKLPEHDSIIFYSKVPYRTLGMFHASRMLGRRFQTANRSDLSDTVDIYHIEQIPYYMQEVDIADAPASRYALYKFTEGITECVAELEFWGLNETGREVKLQGKEIGNDGVSTNPLHSAFDGDRVTFMINDPSEEGYIGIDFGCPRKITKIKYCPWNDDNCIVPGEMYELFYWDTGYWRSLGRQTGSEDGRLIYANVPANALLRIHNHTRGREERPFTYENGRQVWW